MIKSHSDKLDKISEIDEFELPEEVPVLTNSVNDLLTEEEKYSHLLLRNEELKAVYKTENETKSGRIWVLLTDRRIISVRMPEYVVDYDLIKKIDYLKMNQEKHWISYGDNTIKFDTEKETIDFYRRLLPSILK